MSGRGSPWLPLSLVVVLATGATCLEAQSTTKHDAEGGHCDCSTQGRWQPLFKPSQILHSEFPEHKYSDSTGGPRPTQLRTVKILPHLMVPLINPIAISIHHQHDTNKDEQHSYNEVNSNSIADNHGARKKKKKTKNKLKDEHYDYGYPFYKGPTYDEEFPSTQRPYSDSHSSFEEHYHNDSQEQMGHFDDNSPHDHHIDHDQHDHHIHHDQHDHHNIDEVSTEAGNTSGEDTRSYEQTGSSGPGPDPTTSNHDDHYTHDNNNYNYNNEEEGSTMSPYYNSEEHKEQIYDSSKYSPHVEHNNAFRFNSLKGSGSKKHKHRDVNKYYGNSKTRGKAIRYPVMSNLNSDSRYPVMSNSHFDSGYKSSPSLKYKHVKRPPKALTFSRPAVPATLHSDLYHPPPPPPPPPPVEASPTPPRVLPDRAPIYHAHPPLAIITPLKIILREEAKRFTLLRPPAPGMHHTWTFDTPLASRSNEIALLKKPRVLYVMKTVPHNSLSLIK